MKKSMVFEAVTALLLILLVFATLMRRGAMGRVLGLMAEKPGISSAAIARELGISSAAIARELGISSAAIARELGIQESVVCRCVKELSERGIVARDTCKGCSVEAAQRERVRAAMRRINGE